MARPPQNQETENPAPVVLLRQSVTEDGTFFGQPIPLRAGWLLVLLLLVMEWALFAQFCNRELLGAYPLNWDQSVYLSQAYETFDAVINDGLWAGMLHGFLRKLPQGKMMHLQAALLMLLTGPNRLTALSLNFLYFALLQSVAVYTLVWLTKRWSVAFLGLGLLLTTRGRFLLAGGMVDFRLDHIAFCLFGVFVCLAVRSGVFASMRWSVATAFAGVLLILFRFQTALTMAASLGVLLACLCLIAWRSHEAKIRRAAIQRLRGLLSAGALIALFVLPAVWLARSELLTYYVGEAMTAPKIRAAEFGAASAFSYWTFYERSLIFDHLGGICCLLSVVTWVVLFFATRLRSPVWDIEPEADAGFPFTPLFLATVFIVPLAILTAYPVRNPIVVNVLLTPALGLIMSAVVLFAGRTKPGVLPSVSLTLGVLAGFVLSCGVLTELAMAARGTYLRGEGESVRNILRLYDDMAAQNRRMGWTAPLIAVDRVREYLAPPLETALAYERHGFLVRPQTRLGGIHAVALAPAIDALKNSDMAIITDLSSPDPPGFSFPFDISMKQIQPQLHAAAERYLIPLDHFKAFGHEFTLYVRPSIQVFGDSGGWITSQGLTLVASAETFRARTKIELGGSTILSEYLGKMRMKAQYVASDGRTGDLPVELNLPEVPKQLVQYSATIRLDRAQLGADGDVKVKLSFDKFFVPKEIGFNSDTRHLVLMTPKQVTLLP